MRSRAPLRLLSLLLLAACHNGLDISGDEGAGTCAAAKDEKSCNATARCQVDSCNCPGQPSEFVACLPESANWDQCSCISPSACTSAADATSCQAIPGCVADFCNECSCASTFVGCRASTAAQTQCPGLGCAEPECCSTSSQCATSEICFPPGQHGGFDPGCTQDSDCTADGQVCIDNGCVDPACSDGTCPTNFTCDSGSCTRNACTVDADCVAGAFCVNTRCFRDNGTCGEPVP